ncbi:hypothetical protein D1B33_01200 [Lysinibacillus yapensis]|uniref:G5 domain-containing protein n=2 Tax=Ureibacillus yapensis TaxID=2304605 RepID=A0A396SCZ2_9BACL|nr:hypothetical protein D1B33_01200 [Lysinibacillus yapensis]
MKTALQTVIDAWVGERIVVSGGGQEVLIDPSQISFNVEASVAQYEETVDKPWFAFWESERVVHLPLQVTLLEDATNAISKINTWDQEATIQAVTTQISYLKEHEIEAILKDLSQVENERLALVIKELPDGAVDLENIAELLDDTILYPGETFSFIEKVGKTTADREAKNFVASLLYEAVLHTEFEILERRSQEQVPAYSEAGMDAAINIQYREDLQFLNSSKSVAKINAEVDDSQFKVEIYSDTKSKDVLVHILKEDISPRIIHRYSEELPVGGEQLIQEEQKGMRAVVTRSITVNGNTTEESISRDYYAPQNRIVLVSTQQPVSGIPESSVTGNPPENETEEPSMETNQDSGDETNQTQNPEYDPDTQLDLDNNDLPDIPLNEDENALPEGSYYDKGGNIVIP